MSRAERRKSDVKIVTALKRELNADQRMALVELEKFGWELKFIRRPMFQQPVPVVFDSDRKNYAVLNADGTLDENPGFDIRKSQDRKRSRQVESWPAKGLGESGVAATRRSAHHLAPRPSPPQPAWQRRRACRPCRPS